MPTKSPHWQTSPHADAGNRAAQFLVCDRCDYKTDETEKQGRQCNRISGSLAPGAAVTRCEGTLKGAITKGW